MSIELISFFAGFISGTFVTLYGMYAIYKHSLSKRKNTLEKELEALMGEADKILNQDNVKAEARLTRVREITEEQLELGQAVGRPQRNALDGKHQNMISRQIKALEEEKEAILASIIADGLDPLVGVQTETGDVERLKLSEYLARMNTVPPKPPTPDELKQERIKKLNLSLIKGGKPDSDSGPTTH